MPTRARPAVRAAAGGSAGGRRRRQRAVTVVTGEPEAGCSWQPSAAVVGCSAVSCTFGRSARRIVAVRDVTLALPSGSRVAVTGPPDSGKSTLLQLLAGLRAPTSGTVHWPGLDGLPWNRPDAIGILVQEPILLPHLDVTENVGLPLEAAGLSPARVRSRAEDALERLELGGLAQTVAGGLSGEQAQRVSVARLVAARPRLMLADEPTNRLDREAADLVVGALWSTADEVGAALVVATRDPSVAERFPDRWRMNDGALASGPSPCGQRPR